VIAKVNWTFNEVDGWWEARMDDRRKLRIGWDESDASFYLSVGVEPPPNVTAETGYRHFQVSLPLLVAMLLVPRSEHARMLDTVAVALVDVRDREVIGKLHDVMAFSMEDWPKPLVAAESLKLAAEAAPRLERLSLDMAAAGAFGDGA
jgi:hypothetical protein